MRDIAIVSIARTPVGRANKGNMRDTRPDTMAGHVVKEALKRAKGLEADHRSDIYALGIIAYTMLNGSAPYKGEPMSLLFQHIEGKAVPLHRAKPEIKIGISMLVEKMMAADIERRYQSMKDVRDTIKELM